VQKPSFEYEQALIGGALVRPEEFQAILDVGVKPESFQGAHALIFRAMLALHKEGEPMDLVTVCGRLRESGQLDRVGGPYSWPAFLRNADFPQILTSMLTKF
jgi:replicative DNA helicase